MYIIMYVLYIYIHMYTTAKAHSEGDVNIMCLDIHCVCVLYQT